MNLRKFSFALMMLALSSPLVLAQQGGGGGGGGNIPGPTGASQCFISTAAGIGHWTWGSCSGSSNLAFSALTTSTNTTATMTVGSGATLNIASGAVIDFSALGTGTFKLPAAAGAASSATKNLISDTTNKNWHIFANAVDNYVAIAPVSLTFTTGNCPAWSNGSSIITLTGGNPCPAAITNPGHNFLTTFTATTGVFGQAQPTLADIAAGVAPTGTFDFSGVTILKARVGNGLTTSVNGDIGYDATNKNWHVWDNATDSFMGVFAAAPVTGDVVSATVAASVITLSDTSILATNIVRKDAANSGTAAMTLDMSASTVASALKVPSQAGLVSNGTSSIAYNSTDTNFHVPASGADAIALAIPSAPTTGRLIDSAVTGSAVLAHDSGIATANVITNVAGLTTNGVAYGTASKTISTSAAGAADSIFMGNDAGAGSAPAFKSGPGSCSTASSVVQYNTSTHTWGCATISGSGTVNSGTQYQLAYYATTTNAVSGNANFTVSAAGGTLTLGQANTAAGSVVMEGGTSGALTVATQAVAGTPTWTAGTSSGTPAVTASSPLAITAATGNITCTTCVTSAASLTSTAIVTGTGLQGSQTPSATSTLSAAGVLQLAAGGSIGSADAGTPTFTFAGSKVTLNQPLYHGLTTNQIVLGTTTNLTTLNFPASSGAVTLTFPITTEYMVGANSDTTTTHVLHATAVAGVGNFTAIATGDLPTITIAGGGTNATTGAVGTIPNATVANTTAAWTATPTLGVAGTTAGSLTIANSVAAEGSLIMTGHTSGTVTVGAQAAAGTPAILWPNTSGTLASTATAPVALSATTGVISITGAAGQILAGASPAFTATPTLGVASATLGTLTFASNANSGTMTLSPASGAVAATLTLPDVTGTLLSTGTTVTVAQGGTGAATFTIHGVLIGETAAAFNVTSAGTSGQPLLSGGAGADPNWGTLGANYGGTGQTSLTQYGLLVGEGTSAVQSVAAGTQYQFLISNGSANPGWSSWQLPSTGGSSSQCLTSNGTNGVWGSCSTGSITGSGLTSTQVAVSASASSITSYAGFTSDSSGNVTVASLTVSNANPGIYYLGQGTTPWGLGTTSIGLGAPTTVTSYNPILPSAASAGSDGTNAATNYFLKFSASVSQTGCTASATNLCGFFESSINLSSSSADDITGVLLPVNGGSGVSNPTAHTVLLGEGSSAFGTVSVGATGTVLIGTTGTDPSFSPNLALGYTGAAGTIAITGSSSGTVTIQPGAAAAGTYNFNLPITVGSANQCLTSQGGGASAMTWASCGGALSGITAASSANTLANGNWPQVWNWAQTTVSQSAFTFGETSAATGSGDIELNIQTLSASTALPIQITSRGTANGVYMTVAGLLEAMGSGKIQADTLTSCCGTSGNILVSAGAGATPNGVPTLSYSSPTLTVNPTTAGSNSIVAITPTWNNGSTTFPGALLVNPTNTGSAAGSLLADFQLGGTSQWKLNETGSSTQLGSATIVGLTDNVALTGSGTAATIGESTAATGASNAIAYITTLTTSSAIPLQITQGAAGPAGANAPAVFNISAAAAGGAASSHAGYVGAPITLITGAGGAANGTANAGGIGGAFGLIVGNGGAGGATGAGGAGGAIALGSGNGAAGGGTSGTGGAGGTIGFTAGYGGAQATSGTGGVGGSLTLTAGAGGNGATAGGSGGSITLTPGAAGTGGTGTAGSVIVTGMSSGVVQSSSGTLSASTTLPSGLSATNLTLVTPALGTPTSGTLTSATGYVENNLTGAAAAGTITEGGATYSVTRAGIATANLTAPWVFQNTNSSNSNTSITMGITAPGTSSGQTVLNVNGASTSGDLTDWGTGGTWTAGVLSGQTIVASVLPTGAFVAKGTTAGFLDLPQGSTSAAIAPCNAATSICIQAPTSVTSQLRILAGTPATGFTLFTNSSGTMTETISAVNGTVSAGTGLFGTTAVNAVLAETVAPIAGHFTSITVTTVLGGTCSTQPQFNVFDGSSNTGTVVTGSASTQTKGTGTTQAETLTFGAGDHIGIYISTGGATCTTDVFTVSAQYTTP